MRRAALLLGLFTACGTPPADPPPATPPPGSPMADVGAAPVAPAEAPRPSAPVRLRSGRVQPMPPGSPATAAYFTLERTGTGPSALVRALSPVAAAVELHEHTEVNGMMMMRPVQGGVPLPVDAPLIFQPGGYHVMLIGLNRPLAEGDEVPISLLFDDGSAAQLRLPVAPAAAP